MASGGWRVHPIEEMEATGAAAAVSSSSYGGISMNLMKKEKERAENASSMEQAYWSGMRRRMGLHTKENENNSEVRQYEQVRVSSFVFSVVTKNKQMKTLTRTEHLNKIRNSKKMKASYELSSLSLSVCLSFK